ncbi:MAG: hypothetical protein IPJ87_13115 [Flavobacteriales bacterium]|nr:hypothetical protein [Flavobacteriales bacterium]MBK7942791.1 hypothetical protein [Flavobacteriales bacterium]MBK8949559.1 hypothetical protein [Flavobacteriales bacterium]MBK9698806.1 hypothetical protein [Flavobacteriales bacterium]
MSTTPTTLQAPAGTLRTTGHHLSRTGTLHVLRVGRMVQELPPGMVFTGSAFSRGGLARALRITFVPTGALPPATFDESTGTIHLHYADRDHPEVRALLQSRRSRLCYFWRSADGLRSRAWLLISG